MFDEFEFKFKPGELVAHATWPEQPFVVIARRQTEYGGGVAREYHCDQIDTEPAGITMTTFTFPEAALLAYAPSKE